MSVAKQRIRSESPPREPSWFALALISGVLTGALMFTIWWYLSLPETKQALVNRRMQEITGMLPDIGIFQQSKIILVMGVDIAPKHSKKFDEPVRTDTIMLVRVDPYNRKINVVSIPRDSKVFIPDHSTDKINAAYAIGGPELAVQTIETSFGVHIDNYIVANVYGVREFVNALNGIDIYVEKPMRYHDHTAGLNIDLKTGYQHLDGEQAEGFLRFRKDALADIGRIRRQQSFVMAVMKKLKNPSVLLNIKPLLDAKNEYVLTNMSSQDLLRLALFAKNIKPTDVEVATLPGHPSAHSMVSYWVVDPEQAETVLNRMITNHRFGFGGPGENGQDEVSVGILYTPEYSGDVEAIEAHLKGQGFKVVCKSRLNHKTTALISHNNDVSDREVGIIRNAVPVLKDVQLIFSPHGGTFETNSCGQSDYTIVLGEDTTRSDVGL